VNDPKIQKSIEALSTFASRVGSATDRKLAAQRSPDGGIWFGLGMIGLIGWSIVVPTLLGAALGIWLDKHHAGRHAWTLALMIAGLSLGCLNAWRWVAQEDKAMHRGDPDGE
jgi:ATP synthase protein I